jgi:hypothetical protein
MVLEETNNLLCRDFWVEEIADALFQIGPLKASGTDGFPVKFFSEKMEYCEGRHYSGCQEVFANWQDAGRDE